MTPTPNKPSHKSIDPTIDKSLHKLVVELTRTASESKDIQRIHHIQRKLLRALDKAVLEARIEECERIMKIPGNHFVGNGQSEIHWQTQNRLTQLKREEKV